MKPLGDEDLILYYYGEVTEGSEIESRLEGSPELQERYREVCRLLDAVGEQTVPERHAAYGSRIWHRIAPQMEAEPGIARRWRWLQPSRQWAWAAALALLLVGAFVAGRISPKPQTSEMATLSIEGRERIVLMTVASPLERSEMLLLELVNTRDDGDVDLSVERQLASQLGDESRLYRQAAQQIGKPDVAALLEQLETVLVELSHGPQTVSSDDLGELRVRLDEGDVLFRVRVLGSRIRQEARSGDNEYHTGAEPREI